MKSYLRRYPWLTTLLCEVSAAGMAGRCRPLDAAHQALADRTLARLPSWGAPVAPAGKSEPLTPLVERERERAR